MMDLADLARHVQVDLWHLRDDNGVYIQRAVDYLIANTVDQPWSHTQITTTKPTDLLPLLQRAALVYPAERYTRAIKQLSTPDLATDRTHLL